LYTFSLGSRSIRSEAEFEEISNNLKEFEATQQQKKLLATGTPRLLSTYDRRIRFINTNGLIRDVNQFEQERKAAIVWTDEERRVFREKFQQSPKDFDKIASCLEKKSCSDCVLFYYQTKKKEAFRSTKTKKKKGKAPAKGSIKTDQNKGGKNQANVSNKPGNFNFEVEEFTYIDEDEGDDDDLENIESELAACISSETTSAETMLQQGSTSGEQGDEHAPSDSQDSHLQQQWSGVGDEAAANDAEQQDSHGKKGGTSTKGGNSYNNKQQKIFLTRSKNKGNISDNNNAPKSESDNESAHEHDLHSEEDETTDSAHPPLRMTIIVTSPSHTKEKAAPPTQVGSIVSETITQTSYFGEVPPDHSNPTVEIMPVEPTCEDLIRQHLNKMPGWLAFFYYVTTHFRLATVCVTIYFFA